MKRKNSITRYIVIGLLFCCCVGCTTSNRFAKRKYLPGHFSDESERYAHVGVETDNNEKKPVAATEFFTNQPDISAAEVAPRIVSVSVSKYQTVKKKIISHEGLNLPFSSSYKKRNIVQVVPHGADLQTSSKTASLFGALSLLVILSPYILLLFVSLETALIILLCSAVVSPAFSIIALIYAARVVKNSEASKEQIKMAKRGKAIAIASLVIWAVYLIVLISLISEVR